GGTDLDIPICRGSDSQLLKRLKVNIPKVHKCVVCGFTSEDIAAFHKHIPQHKSNGSSYKCQECGLCYTSNRSLSRHLFIVHRLKEPHGLARCNGRTRDDDENQRENKLDTTDENNDGKPNTKCKVCVKMFETEGNLTTLMRTHGMAFIKSKRMSAAEKDPEGAYQLSPQDSGPKHDSATSSLTSQPCWDMVANHQPSSTPSIRTIK
ncbi:unnamed protein product, partial [Pleuronectes platessa]